MDFLSEEYIDRVRLKHLIKTSKQTTFVLNSSSKTESERVYGG